METGVPPMATYLMKTAQSGINRSEVVFAATSSTNIHRHKRVTGYRWLEWAAVKTKIKKRYRGGKSQNQSPAPEIVLDSGETLWIRVGRWAEGIQSYSKAFKVTQRQSKAIKGIQRQWKTMKDNERQRKAMKNNEKRWNTEVSDLVDYNGHVYKTVRKTVLTASVNISSVYKTANKSGT